jgi:Na+-transporting methylmalonyl-CoA/oxaloacetate decarboxylase gamma subunit
MEIIFFLLVLAALLYVIGNLVYKFFSAPGTIEAITGSAGSVHNEGQYFDGPNGYDATSGYQSSRD